MARAADADGAVNKEAEFDKHGRYPAAQAPWKLVPLALETYGRHGRAALRHLRRLARRQAAARGEATDEENASAALVLRWGCRLSAALQRATAAQVRSAPGAPGRPSAAAPAEDAEEAGDAEEERVAAA